MKSQIGLNRLKDIDFMTSPTFLSGGRSGRTRTEPPEEVGCRTARGESTLLRNWRPDFKSLIYGVALRRVCF